MPGNGYHLALSRDEVKQLFGRRKDEQIRELLSGFAAALGQTHRTFDSKHLWDPIHRCLSDGTLRPDGGDYPLNQSVLGGRRMTESNDFVTVLVRPDLMPHLVEQLDGVNREWLRQRYDRIDWAQYASSVGESDFDQVWDCFEGLRQFYRRAATEGMTVVFMADSATIG